MVANTVRSGDSTAPLIIIDLLRKVDFLQRFEEEELQRIAHFFEEADVRAGVRLCEEGAKAERLYVLEQGEVSISPKYGRRYHINTPGMVIGWSFLVSPFIYTASVVTVTSSKVLVISNTNFRFFIHAEPRMELKVLSNLTQIIASRLRKHED